MLESYYTVMPEEEKMMTNDEEAEDAEPVFQP